MIKAYFDGSSLGNNPKYAMPAAYCVVFVLENGSRETIGPEYCGQHTNNEAEYLALITLLDDIIRKGRENETIYIYGDSKLVIEQMNGRWRVKAENLKPLAVRCRKLLRRVNDKSLEWLRRDKNLAGIVLETDKSWEKDVIRPVKV